MKRVLQRALLAVYRLTSATGFLKTGWGRSLFERAYGIYKNRLEAGPIGHLRPFVAAGTVVFDIGANVGFFTERFASWVREGGRVIAIEPEASNLLRLRRMVERLDLVGVVEVVEGVAAENPGSLRLELNPFHPGDHKISIHGEGVPVPAYTVDGLVAEWGMPRVSLVKIDVQGAEERVLDGAAATIESQRPVLFIEVDDESLRNFGSSAERLLWLISQMGYSLHLLRDNGPSAAFSIAEATKELSDEGAYADFLCIPES